MTYEEIKKLNPGYMAPEDVHNEHFEAFSKTFNGFVENHAGKWPIEVWRAFEIAHNGGKLGRTKSESNSKNKKEARSTSEKRASSGSSSSSD